jgi:hypothetical protein
MPSPKAPECAGCTARQQTINLLRDELTRANDRMDKFLLTGGPPVAAMAPALPVPPESVDPPIIMDATGRPWVQIAGRGIPLDKYQEFLRQEGQYVTANGDAVPVAEYDNAMGKLDEMLGGRRAGE